MAWVGRRAELESVGSFDAHLDQPFAGIDLAWRLWLAGREVLVDAALTVSRVGRGVWSTTASRSARRPVGPRSRR